MEQPNIKGGMISVAYVMQELNRIARGIETDRFTLENIRALQVFISPEPHPDRE